MKKFVYIIAALILAAGLIGMIAVKLFNKQEEPKTEIQQIEMTNEEVQTNEEAAEDTKELQQTEAAQSTQKSVIRRAVEKVQKKISHEKASKAADEDTKSEAINNAEESARKFTPEEEELLKKIPRSEEVVVDKEIKLKSSNKYIFK